MNELFHSSPTSRQLDKQLLQTTPSHTSVNNHKLPLLTRNSLHKNKDAQQNWQPHLEHHRNMETKLANYLTLQTYRTIPDHTQDTSSMDLQLSFISQSKTSTYFLSTFFWLLATLTCPGSLGLQMIKNIHLILSCVGSYEM